jgi:hypothetical protein
MLQVISFKKNYINKKYFEMALSRLDHPIDSMIQRTDNIPQYKMDGPNRYGLSESEDVNCFFNPKNIDGKNNIWSQAVDGNGMVALTQSPQSTNHFIKCGI